MTDPATTPSDERLLEMWREAVGRALAEEHGEAHEFFARALLAEAVHPSPAPQAESAQPAAAQPVAWMWQHDETGNVGFIDQQQVDWGFEKANPRLKLITPLYAAPVAAHPNVREDTSLPTLTLEEQVKYWRRRALLNKQVADSMITEVERVLAAIGMTAADREYVLTQVRGGAMTQPTDAQMRQNSARYEWLREKAVNHEGPSPWCVYGTDHGDSHPMLGRELDNAIDAAMTGKTCPTCNFAALAYHENGCPQQPYEPANTGEQDDR